MPDERRHWFWEFVVKDWLVDTEPLQEISRAFWFEALCRMWLSDRSGLLCGSYIDLARICRTSPNTVRAAIADLQKYHTADIDITLGADGQEFVTLINRRMRSEYLDRKSARERQQRRRGKTGHADVTDGVTPVSHPNTNTHPHTYPHTPEPPKGVSGPADANNGSESVVDPDRAPDPRAVALANAEMWAKRWISAEHPDWLKSSFIKPLSLIVLKIGERETISQVLDVARDASIGNPPAWLLKKLDNQSATSNGGAVPSQKIRYGKTHS